MTARQARKARRAAEREARKLAGKPQPVSEAKLAANRANAQNSTGPKTAEGKANSGRNSFKHGLYSKQLVLPGEDPAALDALKADLRAEHQPVNETEAILVNEMAEQYWRLRRARRLEAEFLSAENVVLTHLAAIQRMMSSAERGFHKALTALRQLQKERGSRSEPALAHGFVPTTSESAEAHTAFLDRAETQPSRDCQGAVELTAESYPLSAPSGSRSESASALGFVPQNAIPNAPIAYRVEDGGSIGDCADMESGRFTPVHSDKFTAADTSAGSNHCRG